MANLLRRYWLSFILLVVEEKGDRGLYKFLAPKRGLVRKGGLFGHVFKFKIICL